MSLDKEQLERIEKHLVEKGWDGECPICGGTQWNFLDLAALPTVDRGTSAIRKDVYYGVLTPTCDNCGYVMLFDAQKLGITGLKKWDG